MINILFYIFFFFFCCVCGNAKHHNDSTLVVTADRFTFFNDTRRFLSEGSVKFVQILQGGKERILICDRAVLNSFTNTIEANGNVGLFDPDGKVAYADSMILSSDLSKGTVSVLKVTTPDNSRFRAKSANKDSNLGIVSFDKADYTPCRVCRGKSPTWQLNADKIIHNEKEQIIEYKNVFFELKGLKVFYLPYFYHPDPNVKKKSGFLFPTFGSSEDLGQFLTSPYYFAMEPYHDLTFTPMFMTKQTPLLMGSYRRRFHNGKSDTGASILTSVREKKKQNQTIPSRTRWHFFNLTEWHLNEKQKLTFDLNRASDTTYLTRYKINQTKNTFDRVRNLTSAVSFEHYDSDYMGVLKFQSFQTDTPDTTPLVLPHCKFWYLQKIKGRGLAFELDGDWLSLVRRQAYNDHTSKQTHRFSTQAKLSGSHLTEGGHLLSALLSAKTDLYYLRDFAKYYNAYSKHSEKKNSSVARFFPQVSLRWSYPLSIYDDRWILEPISQLVLSPTGGIKGDSIPNEDSRFFTLDGTTIFLPNRFCGIDKLDQGKRFVFGFNNSWRLGGGRRIRWLVARSLRLDNKIVVPRGSGEDNKSSDYVSRLFFEPSSWITFQNSSVLDYKTLNIKVNEFGINLGRKKFRADLAYVYINKDFAGGYIAQVNGQVSGYITENWSIGMSQIRNLKNRSGFKNLGTFAFITYQDDCFTCKTSFYRNHIRDRDLKPDTGFLLQMVFKNLGAFTPFTTTEYSPSPLTRLR